MPPMPPMPPPGMPPAGALSSGASLTAASVVMRRPATEAASWSAVRTTLVGIDHAGGDEILVDFRLRVEAHRLVVAVDQLAGDDGAVMARILGDLADRRLERAADDVDAAGLVVIGALHALERLGGVEESDAAAGNDAFLDRGAGRVERVVDAVLALLDLDLGRAADLDHGDAAGELGKALLELLLVIVAGGVLDLRRGSPRPGP